ncbi:MAG: DciA family protein [Patescibacteria group bacterium]
MATKLGDILQRSINQAGIGRQVSAAMMCQEFDRWLAQRYPRIKDEVRAKFVKNGILTVAALNPAVAQEMKFHEREAVEFMQKKYGYKAVNRLHIML